MATTAKATHEDANYGEADKTGSFSRAEASDRSIYNKGSHRWPRQEALALLKIRSDMDSLFRDSSHKGALWESVSRKLAEMGYHRTPEKCREKFDNVYKYHKRTKDGKSKRKSYRFSDQLEAFRHGQAPSSAYIQSPTPLSSRPPQFTVASSAAVPFYWSSISPSATKVTPSIPSSAYLQSSVPSNIIPGPTIGTQRTPPPVTSQDASDGLVCSSSSSSTASDEGLRKGGRKREKKWKRFFKRMANNVLMKQEEAQRRFLVALEKHDMEKQARDEAKRAQEMARIDKEHEMLTKEWATSAAKDASFISLLHKMSGEVVNPSNVFQMSSSSVPSSSTCQQPLFRPTDQSAPPVLEVRDDGSNRKVEGACSRWPKAEVHALITIRTNLDAKYHQNGTKGLLWEEVSAGMNELGYSRNAKRCKEKWENINKYFKKVKESSKKRSEETKTCPYFNQLDALYAEKRKAIGQISQSVPSTLFNEKQLPASNQHQTLNSWGGAAEEEEEDEDEEEGEETDSEKGEEEIFANNMSA